MPVVRSQYDGSRIESRIATCATRRFRGVETNLLHDSGFALRESNMATRLVRDKLDLNLSALASGLVIIVVVVIRSCGALTLDATAVASSD